MTHRLQTWALAGLLTLLPALPATAQPDDTEQRLAAAREVVALVNELAGPEKMMGAMKASLRAPLEQQLRSATHLTMAQRDRAADVMTAALSEGMAELMARLMPEVNAAMTRVYVERFTLGEIQAVRAFYDSAPGRKSMTVMAQDMPQLMQPMMQGLQAEVPRMQGRVEAAIQRLAAEGIVLQPPQPGR
jgi:hypothetical protein